MVDLKVVPDADQLISQLVRTTKSPSANIGEEHIAQVCNLGKFLSKCSEIYETISCLQHQIFMAIKECLGSSVLRDIRLEVQEILNDDIDRKATLSQHRKCYAIKAGHNGLLDVARRTLNECTDDVSEYASALAQSLDLPLRLIYSIKRGFHLTLPKESKLDKKSIPECFVFLSQHKGVSSLTTMDLVIKVSLKLYLNFYSLNSTSAFPSR